MRRSLPLAALLAASLAGCASAGRGASRSTPACDPDNGGITLPPGFCALVVADSVVSPRHLAVGPNGDVYVSFTGRRGGTTPAEKGGVAVLRDTDGDGRADRRAYFGPEGGTGILVRDGYLYFATNSAVLRYRLGAGPEPAGGPDTLVQGLPATPAHVSKSIALDGRGSLFVDVGSGSNVCQPPGTTPAPGVMGADPCPELETRAGVWRFSDSRLRQTLADGERWATGIRNAVGFTINPADGQLYAMQHGRELLVGWEGFSAEDVQRLTAEELQRVTKGSDFGWPYCFYDLQRRQRMLSPEYGGKGQEVGRCAEKTPPILAFPAHMAPNDLLFYTGRQFPERYRGGAFIAFHGPGNPTSPGYRVQFAPFRDGQPAGTHEDFATGFAGPDPARAARRPIGLGQGPDGSLYIVDSRGGRVWRVMYTGRE